jgi:type I restriction enzyme S subunit
MLPKGWVEVEASEVGTWGSGGTPKSTDATYYNGNIPWIRSGDLPDRQITRHEIEITESGLNACAAKWVATNSVLIALYGATIGKVGLTTYPVTTNQAVAFCTPCEGINSHYLARYFLSIREKLISLGQGGAQPNISQIILKQQIVPLPPLAEQRRIVAKLDRLTTRIARARAELERVQQLREAFTARFLRKIFSAEIEKYFPLNEVITSIDAGKNLKCEERPPKKNEQGVVKVSAVSSEIFRPEEAKTLPQSYLPPKRDLITNGDVLLARASGSLKLVGRIAVAERCDGNLYLSDKVLRINIDKAWKDWVVWFLRSPLGREQIESFSSGISMHNIGQNNFKRIKIPFVNLPGREGKISSLIRGLKHINHLEAEAQRALTLLNRLEASLLVKAFRGELVPQDPKDEPASALLDRIRAERAAAPKPKRGRKQPTRDMPLPRKRPTEKHG